VRGLGPAKSDSELKGLVVMSDLVPTANGRHVVGLEPALVVERVSLWHDAIGRGVHVPGSDCKQRIGVRYCATTLAYPRACVPANKKHSGGSRPEVSLLAQLPPLGTVRKETAPQLPEGQDDSPSAAPTPAAAALANLGTRESILPAGRLVSAFDCNRVLIGIKIGSPAPLKALIGFWLAHDALTMAYECHARPGGGTPRFDMVGNTADRGAF
jgi:hypothetical protein